MTAPAPLWKRALGDRQRQARREELASLRSMRLRDRFEARGVLTLLEPLCARHNVTIEDVESRCRMPAIARARHDMWAALYATGNFSYPRIAELFAMDHTTVIHGVRKARERRERTVAA